MTSNTGVSLYKIPCPECGSSDANQVFQQEDGSRDSFCFACETIFDSSYEKFFDEHKPKRGRMVKSEYSIEDIKSFNVTAIPDRGIKKLTSNVYRVRSISDEEGNITQLFFPDTRKGDLVGYEVKETNPKKFRSIGDRKGDLDLWGSHVANKNGNKILFITEGRLDAMALYQVILEHTPAAYAKYKPCVVSLTRGVSGALKDIMNNRAFVDKYEQVVLVFDGDDPGQKAVKEVIKVFPRFKVAKLPLKDANEMLMQGRTEELYRICRWESSHERQSEVVDVVDFIEKAMEKPKMGLSFPWPTVTKACFGIRPHTVHVVGAAPKIGKTDHQHQLIHHLVYIEKVKVGIFDLENSPVKTAKKIASKHAKKDFTRPDTEYTDEELRDSLMSLQGMTRFYDRGASRDWSDIRVAIEEMHLLDGIDVFFIDPITALISRYGSSEANDKLNEICTDVADLVNLYPITLFFYSHVNPKPKGSKSHEQGARVLSSEFTGSRAMEKWFHYGHGISRDRTDECPDDRKNLSEFYMLFDRDFGQSYCCDVYFDEATVSYLEPNNVPYPGF